MMRKDNSQQPSAIPYEAVAEASLAIDDEAYALVGWEGLTRILEAAAPHMMAAALREAADAFENLPVNKGPHLRVGAFCAGGGDNHE